MWLSWGSRQYIMLVYVADKCISCPAGLQGERDLCEGVEEEEENGNDPYKHLFTTSDSAQETMSASF